MQPCGMPVFNMVVDERMLFSLTFCGLLVRKSCIHYHRKVLMPRSVRLVIILEGVTVSNSELKSTNSIVVYVPVIQVSQYGV